jgi:hypothetical protein
MSITIHPQQKNFKPNGQLLSLGAYDNIIENTSLKSWDDDGGLFKRRRTQRKAWMFIGAYSKDLMVGLAIADAGFIGNAFAYFYVPSENLYKEQKVILPYGFANDFDPELNSKWNLRNFNIETHNETLRGSATGDFQLNIEMIHSDKGLSFICPTVDRPFNFTYKNLNLPTKVEVKFNNKVYQMEGRMGGIDFSKGYPPRHTIWNWALICGETNEGIPVGMNLFRGHNGKYENAAWIGDERILLSNTTFVYDRKKPLDSQNWTLKTEDGLVNAEFTPSKARMEKINAGLLSHDFTQPFGTFKGTILHNNKLHQFIGYGPVEQHESLW